MAGQNDMLLLQLMDRVSKVEAENTALKARVEELDDLVDQLVDAVNGGAGDGAGEAPVTEASVVSEFVKAMDTVEKHKDVLRTAAEAFRPKSPPASSPAPSPPSPSPAPATPPTTTQGVGRA